MSKENIKSSRWPDQDTIGWYDDRADWESNKKAFFLMRCNDGTEGVLDSRVGKGLGKGLGDHASGVACNEQIEKMIQEFLFGADDGKRFGRLEYNETYGCTCNRKYWSGSWQSTSS
jgi:hypothetical protein